MGAPNRNKAYDAIVDVVRDKVPSPVYMASPCRRGSVFCEQARPAAVDQDSYGPIKLNVELLENIDEAKQVAHSGAEPIQLSLR